MKQVLLICLFCLSENTFFAQPTIGSTDLLKVGDVVMTQPCSSTVFTPGNAGANQTWDFSQLIPDGPQDTTFYISPVGTPYATSYPLSNIVAKFDGNQYGYYQTSGSKLFYWGQKDPTTALVLTNPATYFISPTTFGTFLLDTIAGSLSSGPLSGNVTGQVFFEGDGYGALKTPGGQYADVLRVRTVTVAVAVVPFLGTITDSVFNYSWYKLGVKTPVLEMIDDTQWANGAVVDQTRYVNYFLSITSTATAATEPNVSGIRVFPNPAIDRVSFSGLKEPAHVVIRNTAGQLMLSEHLEPNESISVTTLHSGIYFCTLYTTDGNTTLLKILVH